MANRKVSKRIKAKGILRLPDLEQSKNAASHLIAARLTVFRQIVVRSTTSTAGDRTRPQSPEPSPIALLRRTSPAASASVSTFQFRGTHKSFNAWRYDGLWSHFPPVSTGFFQSRITTIDVDTYPGTCAVGG